MNLIEELFDEIHNEKIKYVVLRNYYGLPNNLENTSDIDILIDKISISKIDKIFSKIKLKYCVSVSINLRSYLKGYELFSQEGTNKKKFKFDFFYKSDYKGIQIFQNDTLLNNRKVYNGIYVLNENYIAVNNLIHTLLSTKKIKDKYKKHIYSQFQKEKQCTIILENLLTKKMAKKIHYFIANQLYDEINRLRRRIILILLGKRLIRQNLILPFKMIRHVWIELKIRIFTNKKNFISFHGPDGVGKTTIINEFKKYIQKVASSETKVYIVHFRPTIFPNIKKLIKGKKYNEDLEIFSKPHRAKPSGLMVSLLRLLYYTTDYILGYYFKIKPLLNKGHIVIFDRYFHDIIVDSRRARIKLPEPIKFLFFRFIPKPSISFFMIADPQVIYNRKQELPIEEIGRQIKYYKKIRNKIKNCCLIDANGSIEEYSGVVIEKWIEKISNVIS